MIDDFHDSFGTLSEARHNNATIGNNVALAAARIIITQSHFERDQERCNKNKRTSYFHLMIVCIDSHIEIISIMISFVKGEKFVRKILYLNSS